MVTDTFLLLEISVWSSLRERKKKREEISLVYVNIKLKSHHPRILKFTETTPLSPIRIHQIKSDGIQLKALKETTEII